MRNNASVFAHDMILRVNRFLEWIGLKQKLHQGTQAPPLVSAGDIWWASIGENVGSEINGKSRLFSRPARGHCRTIMSA